MSHHLRWEQNERTIFSHFALFTFAVCTPHRLTLIQNSIDGRAFGPTHPRLIVIDAAAYGSSLRLPLNACITIRARISHLLAGDWSIIIFASGPFLDLFMIFFEFKKLTYCSHIWFYLIRQRKIIYNENWQPDERNWTERDWRIVIGFVLSHARRSLQFQFETVSCQKQIVIFGKRGTKKLTRNQHHRWGSFDRIDWLFEHSRRHCDGLHLHSIQDVGAEDIDIVVWLLLMPPVRLPAPRHISMWTPVRQTETHWCEWKRNDEKTFNWRAAGSC